MDFDDLKDYVKISYELTQDGLVISKGKLPEVSAAPHSEGKINLKINVPESGKCYLKFIYHLKKELPLLDEDHILGFDEIEVSQKDAKCQLAEKWVEKTVTDSELQVSEDDTQIHIKGREFAYNRPTDCTFYRDEICRSGISEPPDGIKYLEGTNR